MKDEKVEKETRPKDLFGRDMRRPNESAEDFKNLSDMSDEGVLRELERSGFSLVKAMLDRMFENYEFSLGRPPTPEERKALLWGFITGVKRIREVVTTTIDAIVPKAGGD